jgi:hypothetical protein
MKIMNVGGCIDCSSSIAGKRENLLLPGYMFVCNPSVTLWSYMKRSNGNGALQEKK